MRSARYYEAGDIRIEDVAESELAPGDVRIKVEYCGLCGTDVHEFMSGPRFTPAKGQPHPLTGMTLPVTLGHEISGTISECGSEVRGLAIGEAVTVEPLIACRKCAYCLTGDVHLCTDVGFLGLSGSEGGLAESCVVDARWVHPVGGLPLEIAALTEPLAVAHRAVARSGLRPNESVLILGAGPIGLLAVACARDCTAGTVAIVARSVAKGEIAHSLGANHVLNPNADDVVKASLRCTGGLGFDVVVECSGSNAMFDLALRACRKSGRIVVASSSPEPAMVDLNIILAKELSVVGSLAYRGDFPDAIALLLARPDEFRPLITDVIELAEVSEVLASMARRDRERLKVLVQVRSGRDG